MLSLRIETAPRLPEYEPEIAPCFVQPTDVERAKFLGFSSVRLLHPLRSWARLIKQVYETDPLVCPRCAGPMRIIAFIEQPAGIEKILRQLACPGPYPPVQSLAA